MAAFRANGIVTLTTDFGLREPFVGIMKGVMLAHAAQLRFIDMAHDVSAFQPVEAGFWLAGALRYFPAGTLHMAVVDPGVGTARRPILVEAGEHYFIGPDNGVLCMVYLREKAKVRLISNERLYRRPVSNTFHGRDIFAPVAAHVAAGMSPSLAGDQIDNYLKPDFTKPHRAGKRTWIGQILKIDHFGNIITNFHVDDYGDLALRNFQLELGPVTVTALAQNYATRPAGELFAIRGSSGYYEVSLSQGSAAAQVKCEAGAAIELLVW